MINFPFFCFVITMSDGVRVVHVHALHDLSELLTPSENLFSEIQVIPVKLQNSRASLIFHKKIQMMLAGKTGEKLPPHRALGQM